MSEQDQQPKVLHESQETDGQELIGLPQEKIRDLLLEASQPSTTPQRLNNICVELTAQFEEDPREIEDEVTGVKYTMGMFVNNLVFKTGEERHDLLPGLYPAIAMACG